MHICWQWRSHTGAHWGTCPSIYRPCPTSAELIVTLLFANQLLNGLEIERHSIAMYIHRITSLVCESSLRYMTSEATWEVVNFLKFQGRMPPDPPKSFCTSHGSSYKRCVPMLCPSIGDVLATPLLLVACSCLNKAHTNAPH